MLELVDMGPVEAARLDELYEAGIRRAIEALDHEPRKSRKR